MKELKDIWCHQKTWKKVLTVRVLSMMLVTLILVTFDVIKPVWIFWTGFVFFIIILMMRGKKGIGF